MGGILFENLLIACGYWLVSQAVVWFFADFGMLPASLWPAAAVALVAALIKGKKAAPGIYLGSILANAVSLGAPWFSAALIGIMNTIGPLAAAHIIQKRTDRPFLFTTTSGLAVFLLAGVLLHSVLTASGGMAALLLSGELALAGAPFAWLRWLVADIGGVLFFAPAIILWLDRPRPVLPGANRVEAATLGIVLLVSTSFIFYSSQSISGMVPGLQFLLVVPLAWAAVRLELRDSYTMLCGILILAQIGTVMGRGPLAIHTHGLLLLVFAFMGISFSVTVLVLAALGMERKKAEQRLKKHNEELELKVEQRTADLKRSHNSLEEKLKELSAAQETILGKQRELQNSEKLLREMGSTAKVGGWEMDLEAKKISWTDEVYRIHEVAPDYEPTPESVFQFFAEKDQKLLRAAVKASMGTGEGYDLELEFVSAKGKKLWLRILGKAALQDGRPVKIFGTIQEITGRKRMEEALKQSERFNKSIIDSSQDCIKVLDRDGVLRFMSPGGVRLFEMGAADEYLGRSYVRFWENVKNVEMVQYLEDVRRGEKVSFQGFLPTVKGNPKWWDVAMSPLRDFSGEVQGILVVSRDITDLKKAERDLLRAKETLEQRVEERTAKLREEVERRRLAQEALAESEVYVRSVLNSLSAHVAVLDENSAIVEANRPWNEFAESARVRGKSGHPSWNYLDACRDAAGRGGEQAEAARAAARGMEKVMSGELDEFVMPYLCPHAGRELWFNLRITRMGGSEPVRYIVAHEDITNIISAQRALSESEERYRLVAETMEDVVCLHDQRGRLVFVSPSAEKLAGRQPGELIGSDPLDFVHEQDAPGLAEDGFSRVLESKETVNLTYRWIKPDGSQVWLETIMSPVLDDNGEVSGFVSSSRDVSQRVEAEQKAESLARFPEENPNPVLRVNSRGELCYANRASHWLLADLGLAEGQMLPDEIRERIGSLDRRGKSSYLEQVVGPRTLRLTIAPTADSDSIYVYVEDVTQQKYFHQQQQMVAKVFEKSVEGIIIADAEGTVQVVNRAFTEITGYEAEDVLGREMNVLRADKHSVSFMEELWKEMTESGQWTGEYWNRRKDGEAYPEWLTLSIIRDEAGDVTNYVAIFHDITEIKKSQEKIHYQAHHDALTGLPNRVLLEDRLAQALRRAERNRNKVAVLFLDLDNFKRINDSLGHELGDEILKRTGVRIMQSIREVDTVARLGGDEFIVVLTDVEERDMVSRVAGRLLESFNTPFVLQGRELLVGVSIGITVYPDDGTDAGELIRNADMAMYQAKDGGRGNYRLFARAMHEDATRRMEMETELRRAMASDSFILHYQPRVGLADGRMVGLEALVRWRHPSGKLVMPGDFIDVAEDSGLIVPLGRLVLESACKQVRAWLDAGLLPCMVSVNLSPKQFQQKDLLEMVESILASTGLPSELLELEITETTVMRNVDEAVDILGRLSRLGIAFSVDDFGTGYSSLYYLKRFPIGTLKVDRSFVRDIEQDPNDRALVEAIITMSHALNLKVVAEGVETPRQFTFLKEKSCDQAQGYLMSKPLPAAEIELMLKAGKPFKLPQAGPDKGRRPFEA